MSVPKISCEFDSGNIEIISAQAGQVIDLAIRRDNASEFYQWFHFRLEGEVGNTYKLKLSNCQDSAYPAGWDNYDVCTSYNRQDWFRTPSQYQKGCLEFEIELRQSSVYFAYFAPYSFERHLDLLAWAENDNRVSNQTVGQTLDGRDLHLLRISGSPQPRHKVWVFARQHPGETMAEWFIEGFLDALLDVNNPLATKLLKSTEFWVVPNMNPDGSARGNLRTNAAGANLNREWESPSMETSPEVFLIREKMMQIGGDLFLDVHGDEALPYNFVAGCEGAPNFSEQILRQQNIFKDAFAAISPDFQTEKGYPVDKPGQANMRIATNWLGNHFKTLSLTLEMPFKDNVNLPNELTGWSPERSGQLGRDCLFPIYQTLSQQP